MKISPMIRVASLLGELARNDASVCTCLHFYFVVIQLSSVRIATDNEGVKPGWLLDTITIDVDEKDEHYIFYCNRWLGGSDTAVDFTPGNYEDFVGHAFMVE